jgi:hypothetical protein
MKKLLTLLFGALIALSLFVTTGNTAKAAEPTSDEENCTCHDVTPILGAEKNIIVARLLSGQDFKVAKSSLLSKEYKFLGVSNTEVYKHNYMDLTIIGVIFINKDGIPEMATFFNGQYMGVTPL